MQVHTYLALLVDLAILGVLRSWVGLWVPVGKACQACKVKIVERYEHIYRVPWVVWVVAMGVATSN